MTAEITGQTETSISAWFVGAAALSLATASIHAFAGGPEIIVPVIASDLPPGVKGVVDVMWHHITALMLAATIAALLAAWRPRWRLPVAALIGGQFVLIAALFLGLGFAWFGSPWPMPQWVLFSAIAGLMAMGARRG